MMASAPPPAGVRNGKPCDCMCHKFPGVLHVVPCCTSVWKGRPPVTQIGSRNMGPVRQINMGADEPESLLDSPWLPKIGMVVAAYHGVRRNNGSLVWGAVWGLAGRIFPIAVSAFAVAQGYGEKRPGC